MLSGPISSYWAQFYEQLRQEFFKVWTALYDGAISVGGDECRAIAAAARQSMIHVVMGCNELSDRAGSATLYNSLRCSSTERAS
mgnify:CR=1 FL=1